MTPRDKKAGITPFAGIVRRIDVVEAEGASSSNLHNEFRIGRPDRMRHIGRQIEEAAVAKR